MKHSSRVLERPVVDAVGQLNSLCIREYRPSDKQELIELMREHKNVQFLDWEGDLLEEEGAAMVLVATDDADRMVGGIIGGAMGVRGTVNHLAVSATAQRGGIGTALFQALSQKFAERQVRRIFLFVEDQEEGAIEFWQRHGFRMTDGETTLEVDIS